MDNSLLVWLCVASLLFIAVLIRMVEEHRGTSRNFSENGNLAKDSSKKSRIPFFELGRERDEFYITGDSEED